MELAWPDTNLAKHISSVFERWPRDLHAKVFSENQDPFLVVILTCFQKARLPPSQDWKERLDRLQERFPMLSCGLGTSISLLPAWQVDATSRIREAPRFWASAAETPSSSRQVA